ncbi:hypothetical protein QQ008_26865 [Fulvivirgaceae bacterium BMA10]|uniref:Uncharacterized protein n=1 Tax=Splendidivirga corallicola TaxID=3051826 RepID=A0ABT8KW80_9BACT|nr:hypothetical protein [Fulvivirgaceae bacterium BMA10]
MKRKPVLFIAPLIIISLLLGILGGLYRLGWSIPVNKWAIEHGALMVGGFLGTVISLERVVTLQKHWFKIVPFLSGISTITLLFGFQQVAYLLLILGSTGLIMVYLFIYHTYKEPYFIIMLIGAVCWFIGNILLSLHHFYPQVFPWWMGFLLLTIVAERLELTKFLPVKKSHKQWLTIFITTFCIALLIPYHLYGKELAAMAVIAMACWLIRFDIARMNIGKKGLFKFTGILLFLGYLWLALAGVLMAFGEGLGLSYDALLHVFFIGFVFSMIFAHGPIILPGVAGFAIKPFSNVLYIPALLLHTSLISRIIGDLTVHLTLRKWGGMLGAVAIVLYFLLLIMTLVRQKNKSVKF